MNTISRIKHLYAYEDGDTITPKMGVQIAAGHRLHQYYDPNTKEVTNTDFATYNAILFPQAWSSKQGNIIVPAATGQQWYYNNISDNAGILDSNGQVKSAYSSLFETTTVTMNGQTFPGLKIKANLVSAQSNDFTDRYIYYVGTYNGKQFTCQQLIPVQATAGDAYSVYVEAIGSNGVMGDDVLDSANDWVQYTGYLQLAGNNISGATISWEHLENGSWVTVTHSSGVTELGTGTLKLFDTAIEGVETYRCKAVYDGKTYYAIVQPSDIHDPYFIDERCNITGDAIKVGETATFDPRVYERETGTDVTSSMGGTFSYTLLKRSDGSVINDMTVASLTYENILAKGGISVRILATCSSV